MKCACSFEMFICLIVFFSVHGTWISGKKVDPFVRTELNEGDALQLGASSRLYRLHWVPYSRAYDMENPFVPKLDDAQEDEEETEDPPMFQVSSKNIVERCILPM